MRTEVLKLSAAEYHADPCDVPSLSSSIAKELISRSPEHAYSIHPKLGGQRRKSTKSLDKGSIIHALLLGGESELVVIDADHYRTKKAQAGRDGAKAEGLTPILKREMAEYQDVAGILTDKMAAKGIVLDGNSEESYFWQELATANNNPVQCRAMIDHTVGLTIYDIKTIANAHPKKCNSQCWNYGYYIQQHAYTRAFECNHPETIGRTRFVFVFCELEPPYSVTPVVMDGAFREMGRMHWQRAVNAWEQGLRTGFWPDYLGTEKEAIATPPGWALLEGISDGDSDDAEIDWERIERSA